MSTSLQDMIGRPTVDLVEWFDANLRLRVERTNGMQWRRASSVELGEAWSEVLMIVYRRAMVAECWNDDEHAFLWALSVSSRHLHHVIFHDRHRVYQADQSRHVVMAISQLCEEDLQRVLASVTNERTEYTPQLGASVAWMSSALAELTSKQRRVVELTLCRDYSEAEAAEVLDVSRQAVHTCKKRAVDLIHESNARNKGYRVIDGHFVALGAA